MQAKLKRISEARAFQESIQAGAKKIEVTFEFDLSVLSSTIKELGGSPSAHSKNTPIDRTTNRGPSFRTGDIGSIERSLFGPLIVRHDRDGSLSWVHIG